MNDPKVYLPFSFLMVISILHIALSVPSFSLIIHFPRFLYISIVLAILTGVVVYLKYKIRFDFENLYALTGLTVLCSFIICLASITFINKHYTTKNCFSTSYKVVGYSGRYTTGLGNLEKSKIKANQWILTIIKDDKSETFVLDRDISTNNRVTKSMDLEFCRGLLGTEFLNLPQIPR